jgi:hypothetical protein
MKISALCSKKVTFLNTKRLSKNNNNLYDDNLSVSHVFIKGIVSSDWKGLQMISLDRFEV